MVSREALRREANAFAVTVQPLIAELSNQGMSLRRIAAELRHAVFRRRGAAGGLPLCAPPDTARDVGETEMTGAERLARAVLLFHRGGAWTAEHMAEWEVMTGSPAVTTKVLCDVAREVLVDERLRRTR
jgi:hypothetical protein